MKKLKKLLFTALMFVPFLIYQSPTGVKGADEFKNAPGVGDLLDYDHKHGSEDFAFASVNKEIFANETLYDNFYIVSFDAPQILSFEGIGFYITYRQESSWDWFRNGFLEIFNVERKHGATLTEEFWVDVEDVYSFGHIENNTISRFEFPAIGKIDDLKAIQNDFNAFYSNAVNPFKKGNKTLTLDYQAKNELNLATTNRMFAKREFYAVVPYKWTEEIKPETMDYYDVKGDFISSGTNRGKPFKDELTGDYYLDLELGRDFAFAINGKDAKLKSFEITNFPTGSNLKVLIENGTWDYEKQNVSFVVNRSQFIKNETRVVNWSVGNDNRYMFIKYSGDVEDLTEVKIRVYYTNANNKAAWIIRVKGDKGWLPPGIDTTAVSQESLIDKVMKWITIVFAIIVAYLIIKGLILMFKLIGSAKYAFGSKKRR